MKDAPETIAEMQSPSGQRYSITEYSGQPRDEIMVQGEFLVFSSTVKKAVGSGYRLLWTADDRLSRSWKTLSGRIADEVAGSSHSEPVTLVQEAVGDTPADRSVEPVTVIDGHAEVVDEHGDISEAATSAPESPVAQKVEASLSDRFPMRDRRGQDSPSSEEARCRIAAHDLEMDRLMSKLSGDGAQDASASPEPVNGPPVRPPQDEETVPAVVTESNPFSLF
jgi:hypothetical protein